MREIEVNNFENRFRQRQIPRSLRATAKRVQREAPHLTQETRQQALHILAYGLKLTEVWPETKQLFLMLLPMTEQIGQWDNWLSYLQAALALGQQMGDDFNVAELQLELGFIHQAQGRYKKAQSCFTESLVYFEKQDVLAMKAKVLNRMAHLAVIESRYKDAESLSDRVLKQVDQNSVEQARGFFAKGVLAFYKRELRPATEHFNHSIQIYRNHNDKIGLACSLRNLGPVLQVQRKFDEAIECYTQALTLFEEISTPRQKAITQMNLGIIYMLNKRYTIALDLFEEAQHIFLNLQDKLHLASLFVNQAINYRYMKKWERAEESCLLAIQYFSQLNVNLQMINAMDELIEIYKRQGKDKDVLATLKKAQLLISLEEASPRQEFLSKSLQTHLDELIKRSLT